MATLLLTGVTGAGKSGFGTTITVQNVYAQMDTAGFYVREVGSGTVRRVHQVAWYGIGFDGGGYPNDLITWGKWMDFEREYINRAPDFIAYGDTFFYETTPGTTCDFEVDY
jgi:hypothetical protein